MAEEPREDCTKMAEPTEGPAADSAADFETTGDAELDRHLSKPVIEGTTGVDTAQVWISAFLIVVAGLVAYSNAFSIPFHYLDQSVIRDNAAAHRLVTVPQALSAEPSAPLPMLTFALDWFLSGGAPGLFHAVNILLHLFNAVLVYLLCRRLLPEGVPEPVPMLAGLFLALDPLNTESVNYIVGRSVLMTATFALLSLVLFLRATTNPDQPRPVLVAFSLVAMALAWACDHSAAVIPVLILAVGWVAKGSATFKRLAVHAAYWGLLVAIGVVCYAGASREVRFDRLVGDAPVANSEDRAGAFMSGLESTLSPTALTVDHNNPPRASRNTLEDETANPALTVMNGAVILGAGILLLALRTAAGVGLVWYVVALTWNVFSISSTAPFSERGLYFPLCGMVLVISWLVAKASAQPRTKVVAGVAATVLALVAGSGAYLRNRVWQDERALWEDAAAKRLSSPLPQQRLGALYFDQGMRALQQAAELGAGQQQGPAVAAQQERAQQMFVTAQEYLREAVQLDDHDAPALFLLGRCAGFLRQPDEALKLFLDALRLDPTNSEYTLQIAALLQSRGVATGSMNDRLRAIDYFRRASTLRELPAEIHAQYAAALASIGDLEGAERELSGLLAVSDYAPAADQLRQVRSTIKIVSDMEARSNALLQKNPRDQEGLRLQTEVLVARGKILQATYILDRFLQIYPGDVDGWLLMGVCRAIVNDEPRFLQEWPNAPATLPGAPSAWVQLARRCATMGRWNAARIYIEFAAGKTPDAALPLVSLAEIALAMNEPSLATQYLEEATKQYPDSPRPWLMLCDIAIESKNLASAREYLGEAQKCGADPAEIAKRSDQVGPPPSPSDQDTFKSVLR